MKKSNAGFSLCFLFILGLMVSGLCFAADTIPAHATPEAVSPVVPFLQQTVFPVITAFVMGLFTWCMRLLGKKLNIDYLSKENNVLEQLAYQGITKAEELAAQFVGSKRSLTGQDKLSIAVSHILSVMPQVTEAKAEAIVHSLLAQIPGVGATGGTVFVPGGNGIVVSGASSGTIAAPDTPAPATEGAAAAAA